MESLRRLSQTLLRYPNVQAHDEVVSMLARLFRCVRVDAIVDKVYFNGDSDS